MDEVWKPIVGCDEYYGYEVTSNERIRNSRTNSIMKTSVHTSGYVNACSSNGGKNKSYRARVHRIVAQHFIDNPENKPCVDHINRIRSDNRVANLRWATVAENCQNRSLCITNKLKEQYISRNICIHVFQVVKGILLAIDSCE